MRKPRDPSTSLRGAYDTELKALADKTRRLRERRLHQLGELVIAAGADALSPEELMGALIAAKDAGKETREAWCAKGAAFFQRTTRTAAKHADRERSGAASNDSGAASV